MPAPSQKAREYFAHLDSKTPEDGAIYLLPGHLDRFTLELREALREVIDELDSLRRYIGPDEDPVDWQDYREWCSTLAAYTPSPEEEKG